MTLELLIISLMLLLPVASFAVGLVLIAKYSRTRQKKDLWWGLALLLILPGIYVYLFLKDMDTSESNGHPMCYFAGPFIGMSESSDLSQLRMEFVEKFKDRLSEDVLKKISHL